MRRSACRWCGSRFHPPADCPERHPVYGVVARWVCTGCGRPLMLAPSEEPCCGQGAMRRPACADETGSQWVNRVGQVQVVVLRQTAAAWQVLLLKRSPADGGFWQPVTGGINPGEDPAKAALRELGEETGITAGQLVDPHYRFEFTTASGTLTERVFGVVVAAQVEPSLSREHVEYRWAELSDAVRLLRYASNKASVRHVHDLVAAGGRSRRTSGRP